MELKWKPKGISPNPLRDSSNFNFFMMKNLILTLAIICSGALAHATMLSNECIDLAFKVEDNYGEELPYEIFDAIVRSCEEIISLDK